MKKLVLFIIVSFLFITCVAQKYEWRKMDVSSQEHFLAGNMISFTTGILLNDGLHFKYGSYVGILAGSTAGYLKEKHDPIFDNTDLTMTIAGSILGGYLSYQINRYYGMSDREKMMKRINRIEKRYNKRIKKQTL